MTGSGTVSTCTFRFPCQVSALMCPSCVEAAMRRARVDTRPVTVYSRMLRGTTSGMAGILVLGPRGSHSDQEGSRAACLTVRPRPLLTRCSASLPLRASTRCGVPIVVACARPTLTRAVHPRDSMPSKLRGRYWATRRRVRRMTGEHRRARLTPVQHVPRDRRRGLLALRRRRAHRV